MHKKLAINFYLKGNRVGSIVIARFTRQDDVETVMRILTRIDEQDTNPRNQIAEFKVSLKLKPFRIGLLGKLEMLDAEPAEKTEEVAVLDLEEAEAMPVA